MIMKLVGFIKKLFKAVDSLIAKLIGKIKDLLKWSFKVVVG